MAPPRPPRFAQGAPFQLAELPAPLQTALDAELAQLRFSPVPEKPALDPAYGAAVVGGISSAEKGRPRLAHAPMGEELQELFYATLTPLLEAWAGCCLERTWAYGIRSYGRGCRLHLHRDRLDTHVISCIVHADDRSDQPWPLDFVDHEGVPHQVFFRRGSLLLYESLCPHGRLTPFAGEYYRNLYFHWRPVGWDPAPLQGMVCKYRSLAQCLAEWSVASIPPDWQEWFRLNRDRGCDRGGLIERGLAQGFSAAAIEAVLEEKAPPVLAAAQPSPAEPRETWLGWFQARLTDSLQRPRAWRLDTPLAQVYEIPGLLSPEECAAVREAIDGSLRPSTVTQGPADYRTSRTCHLRDGNPALAARLDQRLADLLGVDPSLSEGIQGQRYGVGEYFREHTDWFTPGTEEYLHHTRPGGQRTWTVMIYLNPVEEGGETRFRLLERTFTPVMGLALAWNNLMADGTPNPFVLHEALPVTKGCKYVITKWFRAEPGRNRDECVQPDWERAFQKRF
ncbi:MAG: prolyl hydroxylase family protein [Prochlorococcaceae cyanobacterium]|jgi:prolyl 4-hydroxylase